MLKRFSVENFKNFKEKFVFDLSARNYEFNKHLIDTNILKAAVVFGKNASGKSNLGLALMDIIAHLTDKQSGPTNPYLNLEGTKDVATFSYEFNFDGNILIYTYEKLRANIVANEKLYINQELIISYNHFKEDEKGICNLDDTKLLDLSLGINENKLSFVKYIFNNTIFKSNDANTRTFQKFMKYVNNMLLFYSLDKNHYSGYKKGSETITDAIIDNDKVKDFEEFLRSVGIDYYLFVKEEDGEKGLYIDFSKGEKIEGNNASFFSVASSGTRALCLYYHWLITATDASLIFMDEFDAYYHYELAEKIVEETLKRKNTQIIFTSHNTNLMDNRLFRPDNLFILQSCKINCMSDLTEKELRYAHNLEKLYVAGEFDE